MRKPALVLSIVLVAMLLPGSAMASSHAKPSGTRSTSSGDSSPAHPGYQPKSWPLSPTGPQLPKTGALFGAHVGLDPVWTSTDRRTAWNMVEASIGRKLVIDREYYFWDQQFPTVDDYWSRDQGRTLYISMSAYNADASINYWADIAAGKYDATIDARAADLKAFGAPLFFTFHHEPNKFNGFDPGTPADYIAAWQHIHDRFAADGVTNVSWVLTLMAWTYKTGNANLYYPGDNYTDLLAADGYNWYGCNSPPGDWLEVSTIFQPFYNYGKTHHKQMIVAEWGTGEDPADPNRKANWFTNGLAQFKQWPLIKGVTYYDSSKVDTCFRWINTSPQSLAAFSSIGADAWFNPYPMVTITSGPSDPTSSQDATFQWTASQTSTFTCSLDGGAATACTSPKSYSGLATGQSHTFTVTPTNTAGKTGNPTTWSWTITGPVTTITSGPSSPTTLTTATFTFVGDQQGYTFTCSLDGGAGSTCSSPKTYTNLAVGDHTFSVFATSGGNVGLPVTWTWTISAVGATVTVTDTAFSPATVSPNQGEAVQWNFTNTTSQSATDATCMGLFDSGLKSSGDSYTFTFPGAGFYPYTSTANTGMTGTVSVPTLASPSSGTVTTVFQVTWATAAPTAPYGFQLQIMRPGSTTWSSWGQVRYTANANFTPDSGPGTYQFRARLTKPGTPVCSANYSNAVAITVTS